MAKSSSSRRAERKTGAVQSSASRRLYWIVPALVLTFLFIWVGPTLISASSKPETATRSAEAATPPSAEDHILDLSPASTERAPAKQRTGFREKRSSERLRPGGDDMVSTGELGAMLLGIIGLIVAVAFGLRRVMRRARLAPGNEKILQVVDALPLGPKRHVYAVRMRDRLLVLGAGGEDISLLAEYDEEDWAAREEDQEPDALVAATPHLAPRKTAPPAEAPAPERTAGAEASARTSPAAPAADASPRATARARKAYAANGAGAGKKGEKKGPAPKAAKAGKGLPAGAHRVPPAFRHLLENAMDGEAS